MNQATQPMKTSDGSMTLATFGDWPLEASSIDIWPNRGENSRIDDLGGRLLNLAADRQHLVPPVNALQPVSEEAALRAESRIRPEIRAVSRYTNRFSKVYTVSA